MPKTCAQCHSKSYAQKQLEMGDDMLRQADRLMAQAIEIVAGLYQDGIIHKPASYPFNYPNLLFFMRTGGGDLSKLSHIDQILLKMYLKHRMRTFQGFFHINPDYACWYGWAGMVEDLGKLRETARLMRATHAKEK